MLISDEDGEREALMTNDFDKHVLKSKYYANLFSVAIMPTWRKFSSQAACGRGLLIIYRDET